MAHRVEVYTKDSNGNCIDVIDARYYCSDYCAKGDPAYEGWNGCSDVFEPAVCTCGERLEWYRWNYSAHDQETVSPDAPDYFEMG